MAPWFLRHLGLTAGASRADVRRAYARALKEVDQETEIERFQQLRRAYEAALGWVEEGGEGAETETGAEAAAETETATEAEAETEAAAEAETETETERLPGPSSPPLAAPLPSVSSLLEAALARPGALGSRAAAVQALHGLLDDERLLALERRHELEWRVAERLVAGWQPGHEHLLPAAMGVFEWQSDRRRLDGLGHPGLVLGRALAERSAIELLDARQRSLLLDAASWLRDPARPPARELVRFLPVLESGLVHYATWLSVTAPAERVEEWKVRAERLSPWRRVLLRRERKQRAPRTFAPPPPRRPLRVSWVFLVFLLLGVVRTCTTSTTGGPSRATTAAARPRTCTDASPRDCLELGAQAERRGAWPEASRLFARACEGRLVDACLHLAAVHEKRKEEAQAVPWYDRACRLGNWNACNSLGVQVARGAGAAKDPARAAGLYREACDHAVAIACGNLALSYVRAEGVKRDGKRAVALLEQACDGGDGRSCTVLARFVKAGAGVKKDRARARTLFARACELKDEDGCREVR